MPSVSSAGVISWTNNGGLENPPSTSIRGPKGDTGDAGSPGQPGADGESPIITTEGITGGHRIAVFASSGFWQLALYKVQRRDKKKTAAERALMDLLRQDLIGRCDYWLEKDHIPIREWTSMVSENEIYHELGGNGDMRERMEALEEKTKTAK